MTLHQHHLRAVLYYALITGVLAGLLLATHSRDSARSSFPSASLAGENPQGVPEKYAAPIRAGLRYDLPYLMLGTTVLVAGLAMLSLGTLHKRDPMVLYFGLFAAIYGVRLFASNGIVQAAFRLERPAEAVAILTYVIPIPGLLFFREFLSGKWTQLIEWLLRVQYVFTILAIASDFLRDEPFSAGVINNAFAVIVVLISTGAAVYRYRSLLGKLGLVVCIVVFWLSVLCANLDVRIGRYEPEPFGFFLLLCALGYVTARGVIDRENKLRSVEYELETARRIQNSILPRRIPAPEGLRIAARYEPMTAVAGDFYDFLVTGDRRVTILIADVSGHGVPAALIASMLKVAFGAQALSAADPAQVLERVNATLHGALEGQFVTAACAHLDLDAHTITYAGAGHPPTLLCRANTGELVELAENGLFLGPFRNATYANVCLPLAPGDRLLFYTDGVIEATAPDGETFGPERLKQFLTANRSLPLPALLENLVRAASGPEREDDITVLVAQVQ